MRKSKIKGCIVAFLITAIVITGIMIPVKPNIFSEKMHIKRISNRVEKHYMTDSNTCTGFEVYPLYNEEDELAYFLIEFQPLGFAYVKTNRYLPFFTIFGMVGMYTLEEGKPWRRYRLSIDGVEPPPYNGQEWRCEDPVGYGPTGFGFIQYPNRRWEVDEVGEFIYYNVSHFKAANIKDEKRYLLRVEIDTGSFIKIVAVKRGEKYLNLVSMEEMELTGKVKANTCAEAEIYFTYGGEYNL